ncbi:MAG TPA: HNH endonuclease family protein [Propionicimonas sp.]|nr:HNH endonuclease family protein [Propionicimonas sp.]
MAVFVWSRFWTDQPVAGRTAEPDARPGNTLMVSSPAEVAFARGAVERLGLVDQPGAATDYRRAAFGDAWTDTDGNGCNQRDDVLLRDVVASAPHAVGRQGSCDHDVLSGTWVDPYSGESITLTDAKEPSQAESVQIDHIVALSVAWRYGARSWSSERRLEFANDLRELVASGGRSNQAKGGSDAAQWQPIRPTQCGYAVRYITVKAAYALPTDRAEKQALTGMLATCP